MEGDAKPAAAIAGATGRIATAALPQTAKHTIGMPWSSPLQPLQPPGIGMSFAAAVVIFAAMSEAWTTWIAGPATNARARIRTDNRRTISDMGLKIALARAKSQPADTSAADYQPCKRHGS